MCFSSALKLPDKNYVLNLIIHINFLLAFTNHFVSFCVVPTTKMCIPQSLVVTTIWGFFLGNKWKFIPKKRSRIVSLFFLFILCLTTAKDPIRNVQGTEWQRIKQPTDRPANCFPQQPLLRIMSRKHGTKL